MQISNHHLNLHKYIETVEDNLKEKKTKKHTYRENLSVSLFLSNFTGVVCYGGTGQRFQWEIIENHPVPVLQKQREYLEDLCFWTCLRRSRSASL